MSSVLSITSPKTRKLSLDLNGAEMYPENDHFTSNLAVQSSKTRYYLEVEKFAEEIHEKWRTKFENINEKGTERLKQLLDGTLFNINVPYEKLHPERKEENHHSAESALKILYMYPSIYPWNKDMAAEEFHISWLKRNKATLDISTCVPYTNLAESIKTGNSESIQFIKEISSLNTQTIKSAAEDLHSKWREEHQKTSPGQKRIKKNDSDDTEGDINVPFDLLHPDWQRENLLAAFAAKVSCELFSDDEIAAYYCHEQWMIRNRKDDYNAHQHVSYFDLNRDEQLKDLVQVTAMRERIHFDDEIVESLAEKLHEKWRDKYDPKREGKPRIKANSDGTTGDINQPFKELHADWKKENLRAAYAAKRACQTHPMNNDAAAEFCHIEWMKRNPKESWNAAQHVPYAELSAEEKQKDMDQVEIMREILKYNSCKSLHDIDCINKNDLVALKNLIECVCESKLERFEAYVDTARDLINKYDPFNNNQMTVLHYAIRMPVKKIETQIQVIDSLLNRGADIDMKAANGFTPLILASYLGKVELVKVLLNHPHKKPDLNRKDSDGWTALMWASFLCHTDIVRLLLSEGADPTISADTDGWTAIILATRRNNNDIVKLLVSKIAIDSLKRTDENNFTLLHHAVDLAIEDSEKTTTLLTLSEKLDALKDARNKNDMAPIHIAAAKGFLSHVKLLFLLKVDIEASTRPALANYKNATPLYLAAIHNHHEVVKYLLSVGAKFKTNIEVLTLYGDSNVGRERRNSAVVVSSRTFPVSPSLHEDSKLSNPFKEAAFRGHLEVLKVFCNHPTSIIDKSQKSMLPHEFKSIEYLSGLRVKNEHLLQLREMISTITAREAQMLFDRFIKNAVPVPSKFNVIDPFCEDKFSNRWEMFKDEHITAGSEEEAPSHFWRFRYDHMHLYNSCLKGAVENDCVSFTINVPYSSDQKFLELFLLIDMEANTDVTKDASGNVIATKDNLFELEFVKVSVLHAWKSYGRWVHYFDLSLFLLTLALTSYTNYTFYKNNSASEIAVVVVELILISYFTLRWLLLYVPKSKEIWSKRSRSHLLMYISESRIWIELAWFSLTFAGCIERLMNQSETGTSAAVMSVATMFQYGMMMFYFRPYKSFGHFVGMIERIVWDIRYYMCILAIIVYGYSQALFLVSTTVVPNSADDFTSIESSFVKPQYAASEAIVYLVGNPTIPPVNTGNPPVSTFLACMLTVTGNIILLNLLVAIMNNTYQKIQLHSEAEWLKQLCVTLTEQKHYFGYNPDKYIHYLRRKVDVEHERQMNFKEFDRDKKIAGDVIKDVKKSSDGVQVKLAKLEGMNTTMFELQTRLQSAQMTIHEQASNSLAQAQASHTVLSNAYTELQTVHADCSQISSALDELQAAHTYLQEMYCQLKAACETA